MGPSKDKAKLLRDNRLSTLENDVVLERVKKYARLQCESIIKEFIECSNSATLSVVWKCRPQKQAMNICAGSYTNIEVYTKFADEHILNVEMARRTRRKRMAEEARLAEELEGKEA